MWKHPQEVNGSQMGIQRQRHFPIPPQSQNLESLTQYESSASPFAAQLLKLLATMQLNDLTPASNIYFCQRSFPVKDASPRWTTLEYHCKTINERPLEREDDDIKKEIEEATGLQQTQNDSDDFLESSGKSTNLQQSLQMPWYLRPPLGAQDGAVHEPAAIIKLYNEFFGKKETEETTKKALGQKTAIEQKEADISNATVEMPTQETYAFTLYNWEEDIIMEANDEASSTSKRKRDASPKNEEDQDDGTRTKIKSEVL